jgi:hypothetical protein
VAQRTCSIEGCDRPVRGRGWCQMHWRRWRKHGNPETLGEVSSRHHGATLAERFWPKVDQSGRPDACWPWLRGRSKQGYGKFRLGGRGSQTVGAHRVAWELTHGPIPDGLWVCHRCDNPPCCNPGHLFLGTPTDNTADAFAKGRMRSPFELTPPERRARGLRSGAHTHPERIVRGEAQGAAKLTEPQVVEIRERYAAGGLRQVDLAAEFGVSQTLISKVVRREAWTHL